MKNKKILVLGGVAAGPAAAAKARRVDEKAEIILLEKDQHISYGTCGLPYYLSRVIPNEKDLLIQTPEAFFARHNVQVLLGTEVIQILPDQKKVIAMQKDQRLELVYDELIYALGAKPIIPPFAQTAYANVFTLRNWTDLQKMDAFLQTQKPKHVLIIGAGLIGLETAENLKKMGKAVTVLEKLPQVLPPFDADMAMAAQLELEGAGIHVRTGVGASSFTLSGDRVTGVVLETGEILSADAVLLSIGVMPNTQLLAEAGAKLGFKNTLQVNEKMETSLPNIYAAGDCAQTTQLLTQKPVWLPLGSHANKMGRAAGANAAGGNEIFTGALGTTIAKICDLTVARTGLNMRELNELGWDYGVSYIHAGSHASYYPGAHDVAIKLTFSQKDGTVWGAQIVGADGVDKRVDVLATAIYAKLKVSDLALLDLAYAPPFSSAKDPVNVSGYVSENIRKYQCQPYAPFDFAEKIKNPDVFVLDVRSAAEHQAGTVAGSHLIPLEQLRSRLNEIPRQKSILLFCEKGLRGYLAALILRQNHFEQVHNLAGGFSSWKQAGLPVKK